MWDTFFTRVRKGKPEKILRSRYIIMEDHALAGSSGGCYPNNLALKLPDVLQSRQQSPAAGAPWPVVLESARTFRHVRLNNVSLFQEHQKLQKGGDWRGQQWLLLLLLWWWCEDVWGVSVVLKPLKAHSGSKQGLADNPFGWQKEGKMVHL